MGKNEFVTAADCSETGLVTRALLPFNPFKSRFSVTLPFSTIIFCSVPFTFWSFGLFCFWAAVVPQSAPDQTKSKHDRKMKRVKIAFDIGGFVRLQVKVT